MSTVTATAGLTGPALFFALVLIAVVVVCAVGFFISIAYNMPFERPDENHTARPVIDLASRRGDRAGAETLNPADRWVE